MIAKYDDQRPITPELLMQAGFGKCVPDGRVEDAWYELGDEPSLIYAPDDPAARQWIYRDPEGDAVFVRPPQTMGELYRLCDFAWHGRMATRHPRVGDDTMKPTIRKFKLEG